MLTADLTTASDTARLASICKALGDPLRLEIMRLLQRDSFGVLELCEVFNIQQPSMSHHLKVLANAGLVTARREGNTLFYRRATQGESREGERIEQLFAAIDRCDLSEDCKARLRRIQNKRTEKSKAFFQANANHFREQQDLIASYRDYGSTIENLLQARNVQGKLCVEVGVGQGELLPFLGRRFDRVVALDISAEMLTKARQRAAASGLDNVDFHIGGPESFKETTYADMVSCNMVLHHVASPATLINSMASLLKQGGLLLITDLCQHDQDWARTACGDQWLGFDTDELDEWQQAVGLQALNHEFLALRNGFRVQLSLFKLNSH